MVSRSHNSYNKLKFGKYVEDRIRGSFVRMRMTIVFRGYKFISKYLALNAGDIFILNTKH